MASGDNFHRLLCLNFVFKFLARHAQRFLDSAHIASDFTCVICAAAGTIFGTTDVYVLGFSYLSISIFIKLYHDKQNLVKIFLQFSCVLFKMQKLILSIRKTNCIKIFMYYRFYISVAIAYVGLVTNYNSVLGLMCVTQWRKIIFLHSMEKKSTKKAPFYTRNGHF